MIAETASPLYWAILDPCSKAVLIPEQAVLVEGEQKYVFVVDAKDAIDRRAVVLGPSLDGRRVVTRGVKADERVIVGRLHALRRRIQPPPFSCPSRAGDRRPTARAAAVPNWGV